ncbi:MAG: hypothetical protein E7606_05910 [Ruminococcaceae bacterium]|nr:hypothetical protein [Oscillospiraceae bacterium]
MDNKQKKILGISLIVSAITMLFTLIIAPARNKKTSRFLGFLAALEGLAGLFVTLEEPRRLLRQRRAELVVDDGELFDEDEADDAVSVIHAELSHSGEGEGAPALHFDVPCDEEASEEDFI